MAISTAMPTTEFELMDVWFSVGWVLRGREVLATPQQTEKTYLSSINPEKDPPLQKLELRFLSRQLYRAGDGD